MFVKWSIIEKQQWFFEIEWNHVAVTAVSLIEVAQVPGDAVASLEGDGQRKPSRFNILALIKAIMSPPWAWECVRCSTHPYSAAISDWGVHMRLFLFLHLSLSLCLHSCLHVDSHRGIVPFTSTIWDWGQCNQLTFLTLRAYLKYPSVDGGALLSNATSTTMTNCLPWGVLKIVLYDFRLTMSLLTINIVLCIFF